MRQTTRLIISHAKVHTYVLTASMNFWMWVPVSFPTLKLSSAFVACHWLAGSVDTKWFANFVPQKGNTESMNPLRQSQIAHRCARGICGQGQSTNSAPQLIWSTAEKFIESNSLFICNKFSIIPQAKLAGSQQHWLLIKGEILFYIFVQKC